MPKRVNKLRRDLTGSRRGTLTAIVFSHNNVKGSAIWSCRCDCGLEYQIQAGNFTRNASCVACRTLRRGEAAFNEIMYDYKSRGNAFELTKEEFRSLVTANCYYCDDPPSNVKHKKHFGEFVYNGIDRVDNTLGYVVGNVVTCCADCNRGKRSMTQAKFYAWVSRIYKHRLDTPKVGVAEPVK